MRRSAPKHSGGFSEMPGHRLSQLQSQCLHLPRSFAWCCYGEAGLRYLIGKKGAIFYRAIFALAALLACHMALGPVWDLCDTFNGLMAVPNLAAVFFLSGEVIEELRRYCFSERRKALPGKRDANGPREKRGK